MIRRVRNRITTWLIVAIVVLVSIGIVIHWLRTPEEIGPPAGTFGHVPQKVPVPVGPTM